MCVCVYRIFKWNSDNWWKRERRWADREKKYYYMKWERAIDIVYLYVYQMGCYWNPKSTNTHKIFCGMLHFVSFSTHFGLLHITWRKKLTHTRHHFKVKSKQSQAKPNIKKMFAIHPAMFFFPFLRSIFFVISFFWWRWCWCSTTNSAVSSTKVAERRKE